MRSAFNASTEARSIPFFSISLISSFWLSARWKPAVSMKSTDHPSITTRVSNTSRVVPACGETMLRSYPASAFIRLLFPAFTGPNKTIRQGCAKRKPIREARSKRLMTAFARTSWSRHLGVVSSACWTRIISFWKEPASCLVRIWAGYHPSTWASCFRIVVSRGSLWKRACHIFHETSSAPADTKLSKKDWTTALPPWEWISQLWIPVRTKTTHSWLSWVRPPPSPDEWAFFLPVKIPWCHWPTAIRPTPNDSIEVHLNAWK